MTLIQKGAFILGKNRLIGKEFKFIPSMSTPTQRVYAQGVDSNGNLYNKVIFRHSDEGIEVVSEGFLSMGKGSLMQRFKNLITNYLVGSQKDGEYILKDYSAKNNREYNALYPLRKFLFQIRKSLSK